MADIECAKCGEPWFTDGPRMDGMTGPESVKFKRGLGCPACDFGTSCDQCSGTGKDHEFNPCKSCHTVPGRMLARCPRVSTPGFPAGGWFVGYDPNVRHLPRASVVVRKSLPAFESRDGWCDEAWIDCVDCQAGAALLPCRWCDGTGALRVKEDQDLRAAESECDASDEDPELILQRRGLV